MSALEKRIRHLPDFLQKEIDEYVQERIADAIAGRERAPLLLPIKRRRRAAPTTAAKAVQVSSSRDSEESLLTTIEDAARRLSVGRSMIYLLINSKQLETVRLGRSVRIPVDSITTLVKELSTKSTTLPIKP